MESTVSTRCKPGVRAVLSFYLKPITGSNALFGCSKSSILFPFKANHQKQCAVCGAVKAAFSFHLKINRRLRQRKSGSIFRFLSRILYFCLS
ncbi:MAG: hypothetical protein MR982_07975 [Bacteroides pyogenes]|uniref:hypothetical protein n=1 Tax=Bacteroides pyogenes TaxID=310300 RepID=UPI003736993F|nr:hypothetical protein [Bacteroides pyogenes]